MRRVFDVKKGERIPAEVNRLVTAERAVLRPLAGFTKMRVGIAARCQRPSSDGEGVAIRMHERQRPLS